MLRFFKTEDGSWIHEAGKPELIALEKALKEAMVSAGKADFGLEVPLYEVDAATVEPIFQRLYSYIFHMDSGGYSATEMDRPVPSAKFNVNFEKALLDVGISIIKAYGMTAFDYIMAQILDSTRSTMFSEFLKVNQATLFVPRLILL